MVELAIVYTTNTCRGLGIKKVICWPLVHGHLHKRPRISEAPHYVGHIAVSCLFCYFPPSTLRDFPSCIQSTILMGFALIVLRICV